MTKRTDALLNGTPGSAAAIRRSRLTFYLWRRQKWKRMRRSNISKARFWGLIMETAVARLKLWPPSQQIEPSGRVEQDALWIFSLIDFPRWEFPGQTGSDRTGYAARHLCGRLISPYELQERPGSAGVQDRWWILWSQAQRNRQSCFIVQWEEPDDSVDSRLNWLNWEARLWCLLSTSTNFTTSNKNNADGVWDKTLLCDTWKCLCQYHCCTDQLHIRLCIDNINLRRTWWTDYIWSWFQCSLVAINIQMFEKHPVVIFHLKSETF